MFETSESQFDNLSFTARAILMSLSLYPAIIPEDFVTREIIEPDWIDEDQFISSEFNEALIRLSQLNLLRLIKGGWVLDENIKTIAKEKFRAEYDDDSGPLPFNPSN